MKMDITNLDSIISIVVGVPTILYWLIKGINNWIKFKLSKNVKDGIYQGYWIDPQNEQINCEILRLKRTYNGLKAKPVYIHKSHHDYILRASPFAVNKFIFKGFWKTSKRSIYMGPALFHLDDENNKFSGKWLGPRRSGKINGGDWLLDFYKNVGNCYLKPSYLKIFDLTKEKLFSENSIISDIVEKHELLNESSCMIDSIRLELNKNSFVPALGKISIPMIEYVSSIVKESDRILDLGTGSGFYPIFLAAKNKCKSIGVDISPDLINLANNNSNLNSVTELTEFRQSKKNDLFSAINKNEHFDYIIANLPFSRVRKTYKSKDSKYYSSFCGSPKLLENLILGSQFHIKPHGKLIFCYGESGYKELLDALVDLSSWQYLKKVKTIKSKDDIFYIYELELSTFVRKAYEEIENKSA